ncbi:hypothetical protein LXL04_004132 [Taraxacum kok-saghyz]
MEMSSSGSEDFVRLNGYSRETKKSAKPTTTCHSGRVAPHHQLLEGPVEAPTSSNSAVANPTTDSSYVSTGLDTPPNPEIHRGPLTLSKHSKHSTG